MDAKAHGRERAARRVKVRNLGLHGMTNVCQKEADYGTGLRLLPEKRGRDFCHQGFFMASGAMQTKQEIVTPNFQTKTEPRVASMH
jgi:hypothetical protein